MRPSPWTRNCRTDDRPAVLHHEAARSTAGRFAVVAAGPAPARTAGAALHGRGATFNPGNRFRRDAREAVDDGWAPPPAGGRRGDDPPPLKTTVMIQHARTIIARNESPDIPFTQSINPYQGCEHGCVYCYARPTHAYLDLSPGLDFETKLFVKPNAVELLTAELAKPGYVCDAIALGTNTDPYQPIEREWKITRQIIELLAACNHPLTIVTKSALVERDIDLLAPHGGEEPDARLLLGHDARPGAGAQARAARRDAATAPRCSQGAVRRGHSRRRDGGADDPAAQRPRSRGDSGGRCRQRRALGGLDDAAAAARGEGPVPRLARCSTIRCARRM